MSWDGSETSGTIIESSPGSGVGSTTIYANPGEKVHVDLERIDGATNGDPWRVAAEVSTNPGAPRWSNPPIRNRRLTDEQLTPNLLLSGYYAYRIWVENDEQSSPQDTVQVTVRYRKDGVNI